MSIEQITVSNFKSFRKASVDLRPFNVLIGANAAGKTNFIQAFKFLADIVNHGLDNAVSIQGGMEFLANVKAGRSQDVVVRVTFRPTAGRPTRRGLTRETVVYELKLSATQSVDDFRISGESLVLDGIILTPFWRRGSRKAQQRWSGRVTFSRGEDTFDTEWEPPLPEPEELSTLRLSDRPKLPERRSLLEYPMVLPATPLLDAFGFSGFPNLHDFLADLSIYDFDPKVPKKAVPITGKRDLEEDGSNLAIVLKNIIADDSRRRSFANLLRDVLPFVEDLQVEKFADSSMFIKLSESYARGQYLPASLISDGTIGVTALIVALYFDKAPFVVFEEPERNLHPFLISKIVNLLSEASQKKQIIITTHNPDVVSCSGLKDILLVSRDEDGFSRITRPGERRELAMFLKNEIGVGELFARNLLG